MIYDDDIDGDIYIVPPEPNVDTDEDSAEEDNGGYVANFSIILHLHDHIFLADLLITYLLDNYEPPLKLNCQTMIG